MSNRQVGSALPRTPYDVQQASGKRLANDAIRCPKGKWEALCQGRHTMSNRQVGSALPRTPYDVQQASGKRFAKCFVRRSAGRQLVNAFTLISPRLGCIRRAKTPLHITIDMRFPLSIMHQGVDTHRVLVFSQP